MSITILRKIKEANGVARDFTFCVIRQIILQSILLLLFVTNVQSLANKHMEQHINYPIAWILVGIVSGISGLFKIIRRKIGWKWLVMPMLVIVFGVIALFIALGVSCCPDV